MYAQRESFRQFWQAVSPVRAGLSVTFVKSVFLVTRKWYVVLDVRFFTRLRGGFPFRRDYSRPSDPGTQGDGCVRVVEMLSQVLWLIDRKTRDQDTVRRSPHQTCNLRASDKETST